MNKIISNAAVLLVLITPQISRACATCFGASDAAATKGMNWAIFTLLGVIISLMVSVIIIIFKMNNRAKNISANNQEL